jgi:RHS repeat-associated protein
MTQSAACASDLHFASSRFTAIERDTESGNDYFGVRYYASTMGRFMSPDWSAREAPVIFLSQDVGATDLSQLVIGGTRILTEKEYVTGATRQRIGSGQALAIF